MKLTDFVRGVPDDVWAVFEPILPAVVWHGNGRKPKGNRECFPALLYVLACGIAWGSRGQRRGRGAAEGQHLPGPQCGGTLS
jgi:hypothetical protein